MELITHLYGNNCKTIKIFNLMRNKVIDLLKKANSNPEASYSEGIALFAQTPGVNVGLARYYNSQTYTEQRFKELMYDLQTAHNIQEHEIFVEVEKVVEQPKEEKLSYPVFDKGIAGNKQRKDFLAKHNITAAGTTNAEMDAAIKAFFETPTPALVEVVSETKTEEGLDFLKVVKVVKDNGSIPASLVKELYNNPLMSDEKAMEIAADALALVEADGKESQEGDTGSADEKQEGDVNNIEVDVEVDQTTAETEKK